MGTILKGQKESSQRAPLMVSKSISYADSIRSDAAKRAGINNYFTPDQLARMTTLANAIYEPIVNRFKKKIYVSSFFRTYKVNELIGGAIGSQHMANHGAAMDLDADMNSGVTNKQVFDYIRKNLDFDQLILEGVNEDGTAGWVHVSYVNPIKNRHEVLQMIIKDGKNYYETYNK
jgi:zinc D-Ala-D-Ala carboxypeptidase